MLKYGADSLTALQLKLSGVNLDKFIYLIFFIKFIKGW